MKTDKRNDFPAKEQKALQRNPFPRRAFENHMNMSACPAYFLKKSGILMDCSFTLLEGVLGCCMVGMVPPCGLSGISDWILLSGFAECATWEEFRPAAEEVAAERVGETISPDGRMDPIFCCPSSLAFSLEALPPTL